ncbi:MAG: redox-regulated ATPase YchF [Clostridia bacterium]|nr:redox-regulated ATPase YchF [Clostridia bacterium]
MQLGLIGLPATGKSTLFRLLTGIAPSGRDRQPVGVAAVPDRRLDALAEMFHPRKVTPATLQLTELPGFVPGESDRAKLNEFFEGIRKSDALLVVARAFDDPTVAFVKDSIDPARDVRELEEDLLLADLDRVETVAARLAKNHRRSAEEERVFQLLLRCREALEAERPLRDLGLAEDELAALRGYALLTVKPMIIAVNVGEDHLRGGDYPGRAALEAYASERGLTLVTFSAAVEAEIAELDAEERAAFMAEYGLEAPGVERLARAAYAALGLISFLTAGEDEVRAWPIRQGTVARDAAGKIHSDIARGFIRAEVVAFDDLVRCGSLKRAREEGLLRLEGKDYVVQDGDVISFRFNV